LRDPLAPQGETEETGGTVCQVCLERPGRPALQDVTELQAALAPQAPLAETGQLLRLAPQGQQESPDPLGHPTQESPGPLEHPTQESPGPLGHPTQESPGPLGHPTQESPGPLGHRILAPQVPRAAAKAFSSAYRPAPVRRSSTR
jgi:hypothetical protein